jgi:hypothetical protein
VKVLECATNPLPILPSAQYQRIQDLVPALEESTHIQSIFIEVEKIVLKKVVTHRACASRQCDSCHIPDDPCPAQVGGRTSNTCIKAKVYIAELEAANCGQKFISYTSQSFANLFIHPDSLQVLISKCCMNTEIFHNLSLFPLHVFNYAQLCISS